MDNMLLKNTLLKWFKRLKWCKRPCQTCSWHAQELLEEMKCVNAAWVLWEACVAQYFGRPRPGYLRADTAA
eukprot:scaffold327301_cov54-Tisochrysis_lutea.AAC.1